MTTLNYQQCLGKFKEIKRLINNGSNNEKAIKLILETKNCDHIVDFKQQRYFIFNYYLDCDTFLEKISNDIKLTDKETYKLHEELSFIDRRYITKEIDILLNDLKQRNPFKYACVIYKKYEPDILKVLVMERMFSFMRFVKNKIVK